MSTRSSTPRHRASAAVLMGVLLNLVTGVPASAAVSMADIYPGYRSDPAWDFTASWILSWEATGTNSWSFTYGDGQSVTYVDAGDGLEIPVHTYDVWCGSSLTLYRYQALKIATTTYDTSTVKLTKTSTAC